MSRQSAGDHPPIFLPKVITTLREGYGAAELGRDLLAGLTVAIVALPLSLAIAIGSGATPEAGIITLIVGGFLVSALGGSRTQIGGPTAAFIVVVFATIEAHGIDGLATATFLAGLILLAAALLRAGSLIRYVPESVVRGFTLGIAVVIAASQLKDLLGVTADVPAEFIARIEAIWTLRESFSMAAIAVGVGSLLLMIALRVLFPRFPGLVVAVVGAAVLVWVLGLPVETLQSRFGEISFALPTPALPDLSMGQVVEMLPSALVIAFLAGVESLLSAMVADSLSGGHHRPNAEVLAQGAANAASALVGGLPATGAIARTATNIRAGGRSPIAGISHAVFVLVFVAAAAPAMGYLALPSLAAVLLLTAWTMAEPRHVIKALGGRREDALVLVLTAVLTVVADLTLAISVGVALGLLFRFRRRSIPPPDWHTPER